MWECKLSAFKLLPDKIDKHTERVKNWKSNTKSQWTSNWSKHSNCIIYEVFFVEDLFRCGRKVKRYLYVSYRQRYEWSKVIHTTNKLWICFFKCKVCIKIHITKDNKDFVFLFRFLQKLSNTIYYTPVNFSKTNIKEWFRQMNKKWLDPFWILEAPLPTQRKPKDLILEEKSLGLIWGLLLCSM